MKNITELKNPAKSFKILAVQSFSQLSKMRARNERENFDRLMAEFMPAVQFYLNRLLISAVATGQLPSGKYKVNDFSDEVFITVYDRFEEVENEKEFRPWLFKLTDEVWDDIVTESEFDNLFFKNIDQYTQVEWDAMEEKFSIDGDGDLVPDDEADEPFFQYYNYTLNDVFIEDEEEEFIEKVSLKIDSERIIRHLDLILKKVPVPLKSVFELSKKLGFELDQIAKIKGISPEKAQEKLKIVEGYVRTSLENRFKI